MPTKNEDTTSKNASSPCMKKSSIAFASFHYG